jgi:hypothetical protein
MSFPGTPRKAYITLTSFEDDFYNYVVVKDNLGRILSATLENVTGANASTCPKGRFLYENGKRLFPGGSSPGIDTYMVGVYDPISFLSGYIDPNAPLFTPMLNDKSYQIQTFQGSNLVYGIDPNTSLPDKAQPVYTLGNGYFGGDVDISGSVRIGGDMYIAGSLTNTTSIGDSDLVWRDFASPVTGGSGGILNGSCAWDGTNYQLILNPGTNTSGGVSWPRNYPLGSGQDLHVSATLRGVFPGGTRGDLTRIFIGADGSYPTSPAANTGICLQINENTSQTFTCFNNATTAFSFPIIGFILDDSVWRQWDFILENVGGNIIVTIYIDGVFSGKGNAGAFTRAGSAPWYCAMYAFAGSDDTAHYARSFVVKPARSWQLTH